MPIMKVDEETPTWELGSQLMNVGSMPVPKNGFAEILAKMNRPWPKPSIFDKAMEVPGTDELLASLGSIIRTSPKPQQLPGDLELPPTPPSPNILPEPAKPSLLEVLKARSR